MNASHSPCHTAVIAGWLLAIAAICGDARAADDEPLVLLTNGNILRGIAEIQGDAIILNREDGNKLRLRRDQVLHIATTVEELYRYRSQKRSNHNSASYIDDAKWCLRHGLIAGAEAELSHLVSLDPSHPEVSRIQRQIASAKVPHAKAPLVLPTAPPEHVIVGRAESAPMPDGISPASVAAFTSRVQPMLINRCGNAGCHRTGGETSWQLSHLGVNVRVSARMTQRNLIAVLNHVNMEDPFSSELLKYSKTPHASGNFSPAGHSVQSAEATLREWLSQLGRFPQPLVANAQFNFAAHGTNPLAPAVAPGPWPNSQAANAEPVPEGYTIDANGELIYDPASGLDEASQAAPAVQGLVPPGWPAPVIGPVLRADRANFQAPRGDVTSMPGSKTLMNPPSESERPKRLPTIENPFSADLFNRQHQQLSARRLPK